MIGYQFACEYVYVLDILFIIIPGPIGRSEWAECRDVYTSLSTEIYHLLLVKVRVYLHLRSRTVCCMINKLHNCI